MSRRLRRLLDRAEPLFLRGGRYARYEAVYEWVDSLLFDSGRVTQGAPHVRDAVDIQRLMTVIVLALTPAAVVGIWNTGFQINSAIAALDAAGTGNWRDTALQVLGADFEPGSLYANFLHGLLYFLPVFVVAIITVGAWETLFAAVRNSEVNEGLVASSLLIALILPPAIPLWQAAVGISFAIVIGKEVFGGTGKNFLNTPLVAWAFLYFAYPSAMAGNLTWVPVDGYTGATALADAASGGLAAMTADGLTWTQAFVGTLPGAFGETSAAACLAGGLLLVYARIISWRIIVACFAGFLVPAALFSGGDAASPLYAVPWHWHVVLGSFLFGVIFLATDPVSSPDTLAGHWAYGILVGVMAWIIRVVNPGFPEGIGLAILFGNVCAPTIDYVVMRANIRRRLKRHEQR